MSAENNIFEDPIFNIGISQVSDEDIGAVLIENTINHFTWELTCRDWESVLALLGPFITEPGRGCYQYLRPDNETTDILVILSSSYRGW